MIERIVYISKSQVRFSQRELDMMLVEFRKKNQAEGISGVLLYSGETFIQLFEGEATSVARLWLRIKADCRHEEIVLLERSVSQKRIFGGWAMGFVRVSPQVSEGFCDYLRQGEFEHQRSMSRDLKAIFAQFLADYVDIETD
ncbi:BLUF domain-containing protein [Thaumasiovibrio subtropicus]|uniref:BLUF domain-containing protein n=1 Tax=Thaumasiovibrio subtropicus TaxID=1891207 RepID=UPI000B357F03|nr:BLUF domain-containing protein [Thaumasiovibrio subtropicus]